jgi:hypothetical protein
MHDDPGNVDRAGKQGWVAVLFGNDVSFKKELGHMPGG